jgi:hypothetical protein
MGRPTDKNNRKSQKMSHPPAITIKRKQRVEDQNVEKALTSFIEDNLTLPATVRVSDDVLHKLQQIRDSLSKKMKSDDR